MNKNRLLGSFWTVKVILLVVIAGCACAFREAEPGIKWRQIKAPGGGAHLSGVAWSGSKYVVVGESSIYSSSDAIKWTPHRAPRMSPPIEGFHEYAGHMLKDVEWFGDKFIAVGRLVLTSTDGAHWTPGERIGMWAITSSDKQLVAVGSGKIWISTDGIEWEARDLEGEGVLFDVCLGGSGFVAVGYKELSREPYITKPYVVRSPYGEAWTEASVTGGEDLKAVAWSGSQYVAVGDRTVLTSADGAHWVNQTVPDDALLEGVTWGGSLFVAVGTKRGSDGNKPVILTSPDGIIWTPRRAPSRGHPRDVIWAGDKFVVAGQIRGRFLPSYSPLFFVSP